MEILFKLDKISTDLAVSTKSGNIIKVKIFKMQLNQRPIKEAGKILHKDKIASDKKKRSILVAKKEKAPDGDKIP